MMPIYRNSSGIFQTKKEKMDKTRGGQKDPRGFPVLNIRMYTDFSCTLHILSIFMLVYNRYNAGGVCIPAVYPSCEIELDSNFGGSQQVSTEQVFMRNYVL